jgi:high-affinity iron transporter
MEISAALPTFAVTLREGFEAALVVGIVLACLHKARQTQLDRWVYLGIGGGIVASVMVGWLLWALVQGGESSQSFSTVLGQQILEGLFGLVAIAMLSWMLLWMGQQAKFLKAEGAITTALAADSKAGKAIFLLVFMVVSREGWEIFLFLVAQFQQQLVLPVLGAMAGLTLASAMSLVLFYWGVKINLRLFFPIMEILLLLMVGGLVLGTLKQFDNAVTLLAQLNPRYSNWCIFSPDSCLLGMQVWDGSTILSDRQFPGILLKTFFGYREQIYLVQAIAYLLFVTIMGLNYLGVVRNQSSLSP